MEGRASLPSVYKQLRDRLIETSATREIDRMDALSQSMERI